MIGGASTFGVVSGRVLAGRCANYKPLLHDAHHVIVSYHVTTFDNHI